VVSTRSVEWATRADESVVRGARWRWTAVSYGAGASRTHVTTGARQRASRAVAQLIGASTVPAAVATRALSRVHDELVEAALAHPADVYYAGTNGALAAAAEAAAQARVPYGLDLEDFHSGEAAGAALHNALAERVEREVLAGAAFLTTASSAMAAAYRDKYGVDPIAVHNTFPLPASAPDCSRRDPSRLLLYCFSQTIGPDRGLQDAVRALALAGIPSRLTLRGVPVDGIIDQLRSLATHHPIDIDVLPPADPAEMVALSGGYDVGLSLEQPVSINKALALGNKALTYPLAAVPVALTDTPGQRPLAADLGDGALVVPAGDVESLAAGLARWADDEYALASAKRAAWTAARRRWHWEHADRDALVAAVESAL
jgi:glycosyltransferase involved in cell wall biosynthesis